MTSSDDSGSSRYRVTESPQEVEAYWRAQRPEMEALARAAEQLAPSLLGQTVERATQLVAQAGLTIRFPAGLATADYCYGRITARVDQGIVTRADPG